MYIEQAFKSHHEWWRYVIGVLAAITGVFIFSVPHLVAIAMKQMDGEVDLSKLDDINYIMGLFDPNINLILILLPFVGGLLFLLLFVKILHQQSIVKLTTSRERIDWKRFWFAFLFWGILSSVLTIIGYYMSPEDYVVNFNLVPFMVLCVLAIILVPLQTSFEEYLFRGYLIQGLGVSSFHRNTPIVFVYTILSALGYIFFNYLFPFTAFESLLIIAILSGLLILICNLKILDGFKSSSGYRVFHSILKRNWMPLAVTSGIFGLLHISNPEVEKLGYIIMVYYIGTGLFLGILALMDEGIELSLGFHAANNLFTALLVTADWTAFQTHSILKDMSNPTEAGFMDVFLPVFVLFPILLFIFAKKYKWTNWIDKLFGRVEDPKVEAEIEEIGVSDGAN